MSAAAPDPDPLREGPWIDKQGDVWVLGEDGLLHTRETRPFAREFVERKWGPLSPASQITIEPEES